MVKVSTTLKTKRGYAGLLQKEIRSRKKRALPVRLTPIEGTNSKYRVYKRSTLIGETVIRSKLARSRLTGGEKPHLSIGWNSFYNEVLKVNIPC